MFDFIIITLKSQYIYIHSHSICFMIKINQGTDRTNQPNANCIIDYSIGYIIHHWWNNNEPDNFISWWRHQMETFSASLALCAGNSPVTGEFPAQRPVTRSFDVFFVLHLNKQLSKQSRRWWFETPSCSLWRYSRISEYLSESCNTFYRRYKILYGDWSLCILWFLCEC